MVRTVASKQSSAFEQARHVFESMRTKTATLKVKCSELERKTQKLEKQVWTCFIFLSLLLSSNIYVLVKYDVLSSNLLEIEQECGRLESERDSTKNQLKTYPERLSKCRSLLEHQKQKFSGYNKWEENIIQLIKSPWIIKREEMLGAASSELDEICKKTSRMSISIQDIKTKSEIFSGQVKDLETSRVKSDVLQGLSSQVLSNAKFGFIYFKPWNKG